ncbi:MAG: endonuclease III domain-containing protein [Armatimonadota bacterium]
MKIPTVDDIQCVAERLARAYPYIQERKRKEGVLTDPPLDSLVRAILSQNTTDVNRDRAFMALKQRYRSWKAVADAPVEEFAETIAVTNYAFTKAERIQHILQSLRETHGTPTLDFLKAWPTDRVLTYLKSFPGVGEKSAAIVSLFSLHRPVMAVDTHVYRVTQRLGWISEKTSADRAHQVLQQLIPPALIFPLHTGLWEHGRVTCRPVPRCAQCAIYEYCIYQAKTAPMPPVEAAIAITAGEKKARAA